MNAPRQSYKIVGAATWELIRAAYLEGETARMCAARFGAGEHAIRRRATVEGWTKRDYAAALEARGLPAPAPKKNAKLSNVAERFAARAPAPAEPPPPAPPPMPLPLVTEPGADAERLAREAMAKAMAALSEGRAGDAKAYAALSDSMRKRAGDEREAAQAAAQSAAEAGAKVRAEREAVLIHRFRYAAFLAYCIVTNPGGAPAIFVDEVAKARRDLFGEGDAEALAQAKARAAESRRYFNMDEAAWTAALEASAQPIDQPAPPPP